MFQIQKIEGLKPQGKYKRKKQIVLCHSSRVAQDYLNALRYRYNGNNPYLPHYVINREGEVFNIIPSDTHSKFLEVESFNKSVIVICLENLGWMKKNPLSGAYVNWIGNIYNQGIFDQGTAEQAALGISGSAEAQKKIKKLTKLEEASFAGQTGVTSGALGRERAGSF